MTGTIPWFSSVWRSSISTRSTLPVNSWSTPWMIPSGWAMMALVQAARRSLAERPSRISCVRRLAASRASLQRRRIGDAGAIEVGRLDSLLLRERLNLRRRAVHEHHADVQGTQHRHVQKDVGEVFVRDDGAVHGENEGLFAELRDVLQDAAQVGELHVSVTK